jgi:hypothetical protein
MIGLVLMVAMDIRLLMLMMGNAFSFELEVGTRETAHRFASLRSLGHLMLLEHILCLP